MTKDESIEAIVDGQTPLTFQAHQLAAWRFALEQGHDPSIEELRTYLLTVPPTRCFWDAELKRRTHDGTC